MSASMCRVCLGGGMKMRRVEDRRLLEIYEKLTSAELTMQDGRPSTLCYICASQLARCRRFCDMAQRSDRLLTDLLHTNMPVTQEAVDSLRIGNTQNLTHTVLRPISLDGLIPDQYKLSVKQEVDDTKIEDSSEEFFDIKSENSDDINNTDISFYCCHVCFKTSLTKKELGSHLKVHNNGQDVNTKSESDNSFCKECGKSFSEPKALKLHASIHTGAKPFVCDLCAQAFRLKQSLQNHITVHHNREKRFICDVCNKSFFHKKGLIAHKKSPKCHCPNYKPYSCKYCNLSFADIEALREHKRSHNGERMFGCHRCEKSFTVKRYLTQHLLQVHSADTPFSCHRCSKQFKQHSTLKIHMRIHTKEKLYACNVCGESFIHNSSLKRHSLRHNCGIPRSEEWTYCCDRCSKKFKSRASLKAHLRTHTGEKPFSCDTCGKRFSQKGNLQLHMKIHFGEKSFACEICGKTFLLKCQLKIHYQVHSENKPFSCNRCEMTFSFKSALKEHIRRLHSEVKAFSCKRCGKSFDQECSLASHMRRHTAERIYACEKCTKSYATADNLKRHVAIHTDETPYTCERCNKAFKIMRYLQQHKMSARCKARGVGNGIQEVTL